MIFNFNFESKDGFNLDAIEFFSPDSIEFDDVFGNHFKWNIDGEFENVFGNINGEMPYQITDNKFVGRFKINDIDDVTEDYAFGTSLSNESAAEILKNIEPSSFKFNVVDGNHELNYDYFEGSLEWGDFRVELKNGERKFHTLEDWSREAENLTEFSPDKIYKSFNNSPVSIAVLPEKTKILFDGIHDWNIYCGKAFFVDNIKNHHPEVPVFFFKNLQDKINNFDKVFYDQKTRSIILTVKDNDKNYDFCIKPDFQNRILFCKVQNTAKRNKERYIGLNLNDLEKKMSVEDGNPSINHPDSEEPGLGRLLSALTDVSIVDEKNTDVNKYSPVKNINDLYKCFEDFPQLTEYLQEHIIADFKEHGLPLFKDKDNNYYMHDESDSLDEEYTLITAEGILNQELCWEDIVISSVAGEHSEEELKDSIREIKSLKIFAKNPKQYFLDRYHEGLENCRKQLEEESHYTSVFALESAAEDLLEENIKVDEIPGYYIKYYHNRYYEQWTENLNRTAEKTQNDKDAEHLFGLIKKREEKLWQEEVKKNRENKPVFQNLDHHEKISLLQKDFKDKYVELSFELADEIVCRLDEYGFELNRSDNGQWYFTVTSNSEEKNETVKCSLKDMVSHVLNINEKELEENVYEKDVAEHINSVITGLHDVCSNLGMDVSDVSVDRAFPEFISNNFNAAKINYPKASEVVMYEEPRFVFNDNNFLLRIIKMADERVYDDIIDYCNENDCSVNDLYLDIGKSLRYDDLDEGGRLYKDTVDWTKLSAEEQLDDLFIVRYSYGDDDGNLGGEPDEIVIENESILKYLNKHIEKSVIQNVKNYAEYRDFRNGLIKDELQKELHNSFQVIDKTPSESNGVKYTKRFQISSFTKDLEILCGFPHSEEESKKDYGCYYDANYDERGNLISASGTYIFDSDLNEKGEELNTKVYPAKDIMPSSMLDIFDSFNKGCAISESYEIKNSLINITPEAVEKYNNSNPTYTIHSPYSFYEPLSTDEEQIEAVERNYDSLGHADVMDNNIAELILDMANYESAFHFVIDKESGLFAEISKDGDILAVEDAMGMLSYLCDEFEYQLEKNPDNEVIKQAYNFYKYNSMNNTEVIKPYEHSEYSEKIARNILSKVENIKPEAVSEEHIHAFLDNLGNEDEAWLEVFTNEPGRYELHLEDGSILRTIPDIIAETAYQAQSHFESVGEGSVQEKDCRYIDSINTMIQSKASAFENVKKYISDFDKREFKTENIKDSLVSCLNFLTERSFDEKAMEVGISEEKLSDIVMDFVNAIDYVEKKYSAKHPTGEQFWHFISDDSKDFEYAMKGYELGKEYFNLDEHKATLLDTLVYSLSVFELEDVKKQASIDGIKLIDVSELNLPANVIDSDEASFELIIDNENNRKILESMDILKGSWEENLSPECKEMVSKFRSFFKDMKSGAFELNGKICETYDDLLKYELDLEPSSSDEEKILHAADFMIHTVVDLEHFGRFGDEPGDEMWTIDRMAAHMILSDSLVSTYHGVFGNSNIDVLSHFVEQKADHLKEMLEDIEREKEHYSDIKLLNENDNKLYSFNILPSTWFFFDTSNSNKRVLAYSDYLPKGYDALVFKLVPEDVTGHDWCVLKNGKFYNFSTVEASLVCLVSPDKTTDDYFKSLDSLSKDELRNILKNNIIINSNRNEPKLLNTSGDYLDSLIKFVEKKSIERSQKEYYKVWRFMPGFSDTVYDAYKSKGISDLTSFRASLSRSSSGNENKHDNVISNILESMGSENANKFISEVIKEKDLSGSIEQYADAKEAIKNATELFYSEFTSELSKNLYNDLFILKDKPETSKGYNEYCGSLHVGNLVLNGRLEKSGNLNAPRIVFDMEIHEGEKIEKLKNASLGVYLQELKNTIDVGRRPSGALCSILASKFNRSEFNSEHADEDFKKAILAATGHYTLEPDFLKKKYDQCLKIFGEKKSDMADQPLTFTEMFSYVNENYPNWNKSKVLYNTIARMIYGTVNHEDLNPDFDDILGIEGYPIRCELDDEVALALWEDDRIDSLSELQNIMHTCVERQIENIVIHDPDLEPDFRVKKAYDIFVKLYGDPHFDGSVTGDSFLANDKMKEWVKESFDRLSESYPSCLVVSTNGPLTVSLVNGDKKVLLEGGFEGLRTLVLGKDAAFYGKEALDFVRPSATDMEHIYESSEKQSYQPVTFAVLMTGYVVQTGNSNLSWIEKFDYSSTFKSDDEAAKQWTIDHHGSLLEKDKDYSIHNSKNNEMLVDHSYIDTEENRKVLEIRGYAIVEEIPVKTISESKTSETKNKNKYSPSEVISKVSEEEFEKLLPQIFYDELTENMNNNKICHNSPFIAAREILRKYEKESTVKFDAVNRYLAEQGCTSEKGLKDFFIKLGVLKKTPEVEKEKTKKRDDDYDMSR